MLGRMSKRQSVPCVMRSWSYKKDQIYMFALFYTIGALVWLAARILRYTVFLPGFYNIFRMYIE
jgi:hypothetical protein